MISKSERDNVLLGEIFDELLIIDKKISSGKIEEDYPQLSDQLRQIAVKRNVK